MCKWKLYYLVDIIDAFVQRGDTIKGCLSSIYMHSDMHVHRGIVCFKIKSYIVFVFHSVLFI